MFFSIITLAAEEKEGLPKALVPGGGIPRNRENENLEERGDDSGKSIPSRHHPHDGHQNPAQTERHRPRPVKRVGPDDLEQVRLVERVHPIREG